MRPDRIMAASIAATLIAVLVPASPSIAAEEHTSTDEVVVNPDDGTEIAITIFRPAGASRRARVPVVLHSHGWGGSRTTALGGTVARFLDFGFGVVSIDQRGHGESGGQANVQDPEMETEDIKAVIDRVAELGWVKKDRKKNRKVRKNDPVLGAIGGSYGGGYQTMTALDEIADEGRTRFNALAPEITWYDLPESLSPQGVVRTAWVSALYAAGAPMLPQYIHEAFVWGAATGQWPDGTLMGTSAEPIPDTDAEFHEHGPVAFVERGTRIDVPVLLRQGISDNLFNLNQGLHILRRAVTRKARKRSLFVGYNGGHALPNVLPAGTAAGDDACSGDFTKLTIKFFNRVFKGKLKKAAALLPTRYNLTTVDGSTCLRVARLRSHPRIPVDPLEAGRMIATTGLGAPLHLPVADGPITVAGIPRLRGTVTGVGVDARAFFGLAIGSTPADAQVIQNNLMPLRVPLPGQAQEFKIELPGVAVEVPEGQTLFLTVSPLSDMSIGHGSRTPGGLLLEGLELALPKPTS